MQLSMVIHDGEKKLHLFILFFSDFANNTSRGGADDGRLLKWTLLCSIFSALVLAQTS
jgi:hypothetical protein